MTSAVERDSVALEGFEQRVCSLTVDFVLPEQSPANKQMPYVCRSPIMWLRQLGCIAAACWLAPSQVQRMSSFQAASRPCPFWSTFTQNRRSQRPSHERTLAYWTNAKGSVGICTTDATLSLPIGASARTSEGREWPQPPLAVGL